MSKNIFEVFDNGDIESVVTLINTLEESAFDFLKLEGEDFKIIIGKNGMSEGVEVSSASVKSTNVNLASAAQPQSEAVAAMAVATVAIEQEDVSATNQEGCIQEKDGILIVKSPTHGLFYKQPSPGQPPYVTVGAKVKKGDTLGLLEIMKVFNAITSDVDGEVTAIHVQDMELIEPGRPLMSIKFE
jgi:acetyl-CoA carboxylase biotin carboxyl carrier protein